MIGRQVKSGNPGIFFNIRLETFLDLPCNAQLRFQADGIFIPLAKGILELLCQFPVGQVVLGQFLVGH